jgi:hypothetical protein
MSPKEMADQMIAGVRQAISRALDPITARLSAVETRIAALAMMRADTVVRGSPDALRLLGDMEARIKALEARPQLSYRGIWREGEHEAGDLVTDKGALWHCWQATSTRPGTSSDCWQLCAKNGRDGR